jgi:D-glycero-alpha-D-manno-heptose-7-phosphate kinase
MPIQAVIAARHASGPLDDGLLHAGRVVRSRAPLRLGLAGGGTDVSPFCDIYGGLVLNATIDRYCYATIEERCDADVVLAASDRRQRSKLGDEEQPLELHAATYLRICREFGLGRPSLTVTTVAEAPPGSGLGSSSTLVVALVEAFREYFSLPLGEYEVARLAHQIERVDCGLKGGRQDQYAATFGGFNSMEFSADERVIVNPLRIKPAIIQEFEASLVLFHTGVTRSSSELIERQTQHVVENDRARVDATLALKLEAQHMKEALLIGDFQRVAHVIQQGWAAKRQLADGIDTPSIQRAFEVAMANGALAGKVSGAGGGGYVMFVVDPLRRPQLLTSMGALVDGAVEPCHFVPDGAVAWTLR